LSGIVPCRNSLSYINEKACTLQKDENAQNQTAAYKALSTANVKQKILYLSENKNPPSRKQKKSSFAECC